MCKSTQSRAAQLTTAWQTLTQMKEKCVLWSVHMHLEALCAQLDRSVVPPPCLLLFHSVSLYEMMKGPLVRGDSSFNCSDFERCIIWRWDLLRSWLMILLSYCTKDTSVLNFNYISIDGLWRLLVWSSRIQLAAFQMILGHWCENSVKVYNLYTAIQPLVTPLSFSFSVLCFWDSV